MKDQRPVDHTKVQLTPVVEVNPHDKQDYTVGVKLRIPLDKVINFFRKLFGKKS
jgi:hypothetical protein